MKNNCQNCNKFDNLICILELNYLICNKCKNKYKNNICLKCNKNILDKDFVSDCFCKNCFN